MQIRSLIFLLITLIPGLAMAQNAEQAPESPAKDAPAAGTATPAAADTAAAPPASGSAAVTKCTNGSNVRRVEVGYEAEGRKVPCAVRYHKDTEDPGNTHILWTSDNTEGYCEEKAAGLVDKLKGWGWECAAQ